MDFSGDIRSFSGEELVGETSCQPCATKESHVLQQYLFQHFWYPNKNCSLGGGFKHFLFSPRKLGKIPILTNIFQRGWNHQLVVDRRFTTWVMEKSGYPGCLGYIEDYTTQFLVLSGDYFIDHEIRIPIEQPSISWKIRPFFSVVQTVVDSYFIHHLFAHLLQWFTNMFRYLK